MLFLIFFLEYVPMKKKYTHGLYVFFSFKGKCYLISIGFIHCPNSLKWQQRQRPISGHQAVSRNVSWWFNSGVDRSRTKNQDLNILKKVRNQCLRHFFQNILTQMCVVCLFIVIDLPGPVIQQRLDAPLWTKKSRSCSCSTRLNEHLQYT